MSLAVVAASALNEAMTPGTETDTVRLAINVTDAVLDVLQELPLRTELFEAVQYEVMGEVSIADIHIIMDALVGILKGE